MGMGKGVIDGSYPSSGKKEGKTQGGKLAMVSAPLILGGVGALPWPLPIPLLEGKREGRHGLCSSDLEKWKTLATVSLIPIPE